MTIWLMASTGAAGEAACRPLVAVARSAVAEALAAQGVPSPVPWLHHEGVWLARLADGDPSRCVIGWGGNPTGGGHHAGVLIDRASGRVLELAVGRHLR